VDANHEVITTDQQHQLTALYGPLTDAVRQLINATILTDADAETLHEACRAVEAVTKTLSSTGAAASAGVRYAVDGRPLALGNAVIGMRNPIAPPLTVHLGDDGRCWSDFTLGAAYEGPPGLVHGGVCALVLDHVLGEAASEGLTKPLFTGTISVRYLRGTPLGRLRAEAVIETREAIKTFVRGSISDAAGHTAEAEGVFIRPAWAR
jgi:acyl-coenzyme A thioesterase PaaI-like protein